MRTIRVLITLLVVLLLAACQASSESSAGSSKSPEHMGVFLSDGALYIEIPLHKGPPASDYSSSVTTTISEPTIYHWVHNTDLSNLSLRNWTTRDRIQYQATPLMTGGFEIIAASPVRDGLYCLVQGNPFQAANEISHWCFRVASGTSSEVDSDAVAGEATVTRESNIVVENKSTEAPATIVLPPKVQVVTNPGAETVELHVLTGIPFGSLDETLIFEDQYLKLTVKYLDPRMGQLTLLGQATGVIPVDVFTNVDDSLTTHVVPQHPLENDVYCLMQGNTTSESAAAAHWCFRVETTGGTYGTPSVEVLVITSEGSKVFQLPLISGVPFEAPSDTVTIEDKNPIITIRNLHPTMGPLTLLGQASGVAPTRVSTNEYDASATHLVVLEPLADDLYCVVLGDMPTSAGATNHWCFRVVTGGGSD
jgi:hypothetical protein